MTIGTTGAAIIGAGASVLGGIAEGRSERRAADTQSAAIQESIAEQRRTFDKIVELNEPFRESNLRAMRAQEDLLGLGGGGQVGPSAGSQTQPPAQTGQAPMPPLSRGGDSPMFGRQSPLDRTRRDRHIEEQIRNIADVPNAEQNRQVFLRQMVDQGHIAPDNRFVRNALRRPGT